MPDQKISEMTEATSLTGVELAGAVGGENVRVPTSLFGSGGGVNLALHSVAIANGSQQGIPANTVTKITVLSVEDWNPNDYWDVTNQRFQPDQEGLYLVSGKVTLEELDDGQRMVVFLYKNGAQYAMLGRGTSGGSGQPAGYDGTILVQMNGTTDYLELHGFHANAATTFTDASTRYTTFCATYVGPSS